MIRLPEDTRKVTPKDEFGMTRYQNVSPEILLSEPGNTGF